MIHLKNSNDVMIYTILEIVFLVAYFTFVEALIELKMASFWPFGRGHFPTSQTTGNRPILSYLSLA